MKCQKSLAVSINILISLSFVLLTEAKIFDRYELAKILYDNGLTDITRWICMTDVLSGFNSSKLVIGEDDSGHGIFTIYHPFWCGINERSGKCGIKCESLRDDDLRDDIECVKMILDQQGVEAWEYALGRCRNNELNDVPDWVWARSLEVDAGKYCPPERDRSKRYVNNASAIGDGSID